MSLYKGTINGFSGSWMSGLATLIVNGLPVMCENPTTVRSLDDAFGDVIAEGHTVSNKGIEGKRIVFSVDAIGILEGFTPEDEFDNRHGKPEEYGGGPSPRKRHSSPRISLKAAALS